ncbi:MAG: hypothetical protein DRH15_13310 [Deltaproteobacteria bacterium]|nr:MAG: hypothetical protein DRH15_13310 [Deltaproteobacteria bacterium]
MLILKVFDMILLIKISLSESCEETECKRFYIKLVVISKSYGVFRKIDSAYCYSFIKYRHIVINLTAKKENLK